MTPVRSLARVMLSGIFVVSGYRNLRSPERLAKKAAPVTDRVAPTLQKLNPRIPTDTVQLIRLNSAVQLGAGLMLATGRLTRPAALVLAGTIVPTTIAGHPFWNDDDPVTRDTNKVHFLKNLGLLGGLLLAAADTEGKPGLRWRTGHRIGHSRRSMQRAVRTARREARIAVRSASTARRLPG
ncbi:MULTISPECIES: DoxX family protein [Micromonospora]|uniref:DoxX family protein n=1 Tax=Micromonospora zamorensis TaxID=709883 RepID=A0ABZ1PC50_9ACTN|nr:MULTISPECIES: DoxX family protein [Micromonospora]MBQ1035995.1 DoxX family protein [Micromonospora sp. C81]TQJ25835.1 putative membrane protein YphA (DoxX/SURF4 family) [Micromonospora sp. A202]WSK51901.1 DoxX family protein [Micromonospora zamorensis]WTE85578.1 DoxX family protein [Micromonospora zamorensis]WTI20371.1 DoxX family protein [Micromonospora zamorensis]